MASNREPAVLLRRSPSGRECSQALDSGTLAIGRAGENDLVLSSPFVSRHHALLSGSNGVYSLSDLGGPNGTLVNGQRLGLSDQRLQDGDVILLGDIRLYFRQRPPEPPSTMTLPLEAQPTEIFPASFEQLQRAQQALLAGEAVLGPFDSIYLLYAHLQRPQAIEAIFRAKDRPADKPLTVIAKPADMSLLADIPPVYLPLIERWFPGPVTLIFPKRAEVPDWVTRNLPTVGLTYGRHPFVQFLVEDYPLCGTSANLSGRPAPQTIREALDQLDRRVRIGFDGGPTFYAESNTVIDLAGEQPRLIRKAAGWARVVDHFPLLADQVPTAQGND